MGVLSGVTLEFGTCVSSCFRALYLILNAISSCFVLNCCARNPLFINGWTSENEESDLTIPSLYTMKKDPFS